MQKVSYMGDGVTTEFFFNFPFFENSNVVVTVNNEPATGYNIIGTTGGLNPDIPYTGGKVVFEVAPTSIDCIAIARNLPLERIVDYQPLSKIDPTTLNQDLNYLMEVIKDRKDELADLTTKYTEIADKESTEIILARISAIHEEIVDIDAKIRALGDIGSLRQDVTDLTTTVGGHTTSISALDTTVDGHTTSISNLDLQKSNIDMNNLSNSGTENLIDFCMPDYSRGVEYTSNASGILQYDSKVFVQTSTNKETYVNFTIVDSDNTVLDGLRCWGTTQTSRAINNSAVFPKGSNYNIVITNGGTNWAKVIIYPLKGSN